MTLHRFEEREMDTYKTSLKTFLETLCHAQLVRVTFVVDLNKAFSKDVCKLMR